MDVGVWERRRRLGDESVLVVPGAKGVDSVDTRRGENTGKLIGSCTLYTLLTQLSPGLLVQRRRQCTHIKGCAESLEPLGKQLLLLPPPLLRLLWA